MVLERWPLIIRTSTARIYSLGGGKADIPDQCLNTTNNTSLQSTQGAPFRALSGSYSLLDKLP